MSEAVFGVEINFWTDHSIAERIRQKFPQLEYAGLGETRTTVFSVYDALGSFIVEMSYGNVTKRFDGCAIEMVERLIEGRLK